MDWTTICAAWGPAIPMLVFFLKCHRDLIYTVIPQGFSILRDEIASSRELAAKFHNEHMAAMDGIAELLAKQHAERKKARRSRSKQAAKAARFPEPEIPRKKRTPKRTD